MKMLLSKKGFTLIELMIVVAIIGILAAIAIPQFAQLISKSQEGQTKGNLGTIRSALSIYYGDTEGRYPDDTLSSLTLASKYLQALPQASLPRTTNNLGHNATNLVETATIQTSAAGAVEGGWAYDNGGTSSTWGSVVVDCTHSDLRGFRWTSY